MSETKKLLAFIEVLRQYFTIGGMATANFDRLAEIVRQSEWIPVGEKLPNTAPDESGEPPQYSVMIKGAYLPTQLCIDKDGKFFDWAYDSTFHYYEVSHWKMLPEPPTGKKEDDNG